MFNSHAPVCGARRKYDGQPCQNPAMRNGRCRMHGGKVPEKHGRYSKRAKAERAAFRASVKALRAASKAMSDVEEKSETADET